MVAIASDPLEIECPSCAAPINDGCVAKRGAAFPSSEFHATRVIAAEKFLGAARDIVLAAGAQLFGDAWSIRGATREQLDEVAMLVEDTENVE